MRRLKAELINCTSYSLQIPPERISISECKGHNRHDFIFYQVHGKQPAQSIGGHYWQPSQSQAIEGSLKRLKTDYIDSYIPHFDDGITPLEEIARGLEDLVID